jgi:hypothetical protein
LKNRIIENNNKIVLRGECTGNLYKYLILFSRNWISINPWKQKSSKKYFIFWAGMCLCVWDLMLNTSRSVVREETHNNNFVKLTYFTQLFQGIDTSHVFSIDLSLFNIQQSEKSSVNLTSNLNYQKIDILSEKILPKSPFSNLVKI